MYKRFDTFDLLSEKILGICEWKKLLLTYPGPMGLNYNGVQELHHWVSESLNVSQDTERHTVAEQMIFSSVLQELSSMRCNQSLNPDRG